MGNYVNKFLSHNNETVIEEMKTENEVILEENIMQTPKTVHKTLSIDPRSVTAGIDRTPIEVNCTPVELNKRMISAIPKHLQRKPYLETDLDKVMLCLTPKSPSTPEMENKGEGINVTPVITANGKKVNTEVQKDRFDILRLDPRSPATDFDRTPILMPKSVDLFKARSQESLQRLANYNKDVSYSRFSYCETSSQFNVPEIQALPDLAAYRMKPSNLDFASDELSCSSHSSTSEMSCGVESEEEIEGISRENNFKGTPQEVQSVNETDIIKVWRDSLVLEKSNELESEKARKLAKEEVIITFDSDSIAKDTVLKLSKHENNKTIEIKEGEKKKKKIPLKGQAVNATDEKKVFNSNDKSATESSKIRTPLGNRSNNGQMQAFSTKSPQQVFRGKGITSKMLQENTPPHKNYIGKSKLSGIQWDPDSTVII